MKLFKKIPLISWFLITSCIIICLFSYLRTFQNYELISYDLRLRLRPPLKTSPDIILIEISDDTLKNLGQWPLPRDFHASLVKVLKEFGVRSVIFDVLFCEPTLYDDVFSEAIRDAGNVSLAEAFYLKEHLKRDYGPAQSSSSSVLAEVCPGIKRSKAEIGHVNVFVDPDGKVRRVPLFVQYNNMVFANLGLKAALGWLGLDSKNVEFKKTRVIIDNKLVLPVSYNSSFLVNYPDKWEKSFRHFSYFEILKSYNDIRNGIKPKIDLSLLKGKACFIGLTATGTADLRAVPLENIYPMLGLQASVFNSLLNRSFIKDAGPFFNTLINIIIFILSLLICLRWPPLKALLGNIILGLSYFFISTVIFISKGIWIDLFLPVSIITITYGVFLFYRFIDELRKRQLLEKELDIARTIQSSFLPAGLKEFPGLSISSFMQPAKFVAGDFYDILPLGDKRLGVLIGDVSGKGVPASLIMAQTISLFRVFAHQYSNCSECLSRLNKELCGRFSQRFVTVLYMVVDTAENKVRVSSAGHGPLLLYKNDENRIKEVDLAIEVPLGIMEDQGYKEVEFDFGKGDKIVIFTDGVYEARNRERQEFGVERVKNIILGNSNYSAEKISDSIKEGIFEFSSHCPQHDDITLIVLTNN